LRGVAMLAAGIAEALPLRSESLDFISMGYALRHVADLRPAFAELRRVLRPGGRLLILEMVPPQAPLPRFLSRLYLKHLVPSLTTLVTGNRRARRLMQYYWETVDHCVPPEVVMEALRAAGFAEVRRTVQFGLLTEYQGVRDAEPL
jgi:demethylmenaquinone methyltransferase / 2-methoxy-6-polyprenyl-1,4-benzoquinol methylase